MHALTRAISARTFIRNRRDNAHLVICLKNIKHGKNLSLDKNVHFYGDVVLGDNVIIEDDVCIGYRRLTKLREGYDDNPPTKIGSNVLIRRNTMIYAGCVIGDNSTVNANTILREYTEIGSNTSIGSLCMCEGYTRIGNHCTIHAQCHITAKMAIEDYVFIAPLLSTANDREIRYYRPQHTRPDRGPTIKRGAFVGGGVCILPEVTIGEETIVAVGSVVTRDLPPRVVAMGVPAKVVRRIRDDERLNAPAE
jgi:acetyltransferase-like isoleucine patch superfamily enzyme